MYPASWYLWYLLQMEECNEREIILFYTEVRFPLVQKIECVLWYFREKKFVGKWKGMWKRLRHLAFGFKHCEGAPKQWENEWVWGFLEVPMRKKRGLTFVGSRTKWSCKESGAWDAYPVSIIYWMCYLDYLKWSQDAPILAIQEKGEGVILNFTVSPCGCKSRIGPQFCLCNSQAAQKLRE